MDFDHQMATSRTIEGRQCPKLKEGKHASLDFRVCSILAKSIETGLLELL
jgi:hypothetical protein